MALHVHLSESAIIGATGNGLELARLELGNRILLADQIRGWCGNPDTKVVQPVLDINQQIRVDQYEIPAHRD